MNDMRVTRMDILMYGFVITALFDEQYPSGSTTIEQMETDSATHSWILAVLPSLTNRKQMDNYVDVSEVAM